MTNLSADGEILASIFAARVTLAKKTREEALVEAAQEWEATQKWVASASQKPQSFIWFCDEFDLDVGAVRREIRKAQGLAAKPKA